MPPVIAIANQQRNARVSAPRLRKLAGWLRQTANLQETAISIALVDDAGITPINEQFVGHTGPTDVISFLYAPLPGQLDACAELIINVQRALEEARRRRVEPDYELALYLAHGILHLAGENDATPRQRANMARIQAGWLRKARREGLLAGLVFQRL